jgi:hypothetical protein
MLDGSENAIFLQALSGGSTNGHFTEGHRATLNEEQRPIARAEPVTPPDFTVLILPMPVNELSRTEAAGRERQLPRRQIDWSKNAQAPFRQTKCDAQGFLAPAFSWR